MDPSTNCLGLTIFDINVKKPEPFKLVYANTIFGSKVNYDIPSQHDDSSFTGVEARVYGLARATGKLINLYEPESVICEDSFLGASADTFKQAIKAYGMFRQVCNEHNLHLSLVLPNIAKEIVGANFRGTTKEDVMQGIQDYKHLDSGDIDLSLLDEHSADSVAIGLYRCEVIAKDYGVYVDVRGN